VGHALETFRALWKWLDHHMRDGEYSLELHAWGQGIHGQFTAQASVLDKNPFLNPKEAIES